MTSGPQSQTPLMSPRRPEAETTASMQARPFQPDVLEPPQVLDRLANAHPEQVPVPVTLFQEPVCLHPSLDFRVVTMFWD